MTGKATGETNLAVVDHSHALARVKQANAIGMFPDKMTVEQMDILAEVAFRYGLDPYMGELIPYQGKPYVTIKGRRRKDAEAEHHGKISFRPLNQAELDLYYEADALDKMDLAIFCVVEDVDTRASVEGFGRVLASERKGNANLPTVSRVIEMAQKRAEVRAREMLWGPIAKPKGLEGIVVGMEGDEANVVEGTSRAVDEAPQTASQSLPDYGKCPEHNVAWQSKEVTFGSETKILASHRIDGGGFHRLDEFLRKVFNRHWQESHDGKYLEKDINDWLKDHYKGKTWSKMSIEEMRDAIAAVQGVDTETGETPLEGEVGEVDDLTPAMTAEEQAYAEAQGMVE